MKLSGNTILVTGGGSGIGLALALELKRLGNEVIVAGRTAAKLGVARSSGLHTFEVDMTHEQSVNDLVSKVIAAFPTLNTVILNAGVMMNEKLTASNTSNIANQTMATNFLGPVWLINALLPHFLAQTSATIVTVTSGLAFVPLAMTPTYSASKAAIHSYTQSLRYQLRDTSIQVKELAPPYVQTALMGSRQEADPNAMPLPDFIHEVISILRDQPDAEEILVNRVLNQRRAADQGEQKYQEIFKNQNDMLMRLRQKEWDAL